MTTRCLLFANGIGSIAYESPNDYASSKYLSIDKVFYHYDDIGVDKSLCVYRVFCLRDCVCTYKYYEDYVYRLEYVINRYAKNYPRVLVVKYDDNMPTNISDKDVLMFANKLDGESKNILGIVNV